MAARLAVLVEFAVSLISSTKRELGEHLTGGFALLLSSSTMVKA